MSRERPVSSGSASALGRLGERTLDGREPQAEVGGSGDRFSRVWIPAVSASVGEPCLSHSLRHSHAALLIEQGVHTKAIQARLGHGDIRTTPQLYGHMFEA
ncbi:MAG: tyrosine-type recombinase/integrase [Acidimicrobiia bacterium]